MRLAAFLRIVRKKKNLPNPEKLISDNISSSAGQKSGGRRKGKPNECKPALMTIRERTTTTTTSTCTTTSASESAFTTCDSNAVKATGGSAFSDSAAAAALLALSGGAVQCNNFTLKCLSGTQVRMCYGCGSSIRTPPQVPDPPHDYCIVNREYRAYKAPDGTTKVGNEPQNCHYHLRMSCVRRKHSDFGLGVLRIPLSLREKLSVKHWSWLDHEFGVLDLSQVWLRMLLIIVKSLLDNRNSGFFRLNLCEEAYTNSYMPCDTKFLYIKMTKNTASLLREWCVQTKTFPNLCSCSYYLFIPFVHIICSWYWCHHSTSRF